MRSVRYMAERMREAREARVSRLLGEPLDYERSKMPVRGIIFTRTARGEGLAIGFPFVSHSGVDGQTFMVL